ncbi:PIR protein [Plasmodium brasilianum]|uniref:PIR protein n=1 Tax=Plasmodium brasilianum TaxID=5824 RepID=A0ACB9Y244_PLABR|nr:PIR protein [Plasmodium brasilianum]
MGSLLPTNNFYNELIKEIKVEDEKLNLHKSTILTNIPEAYWLKNLLKKLIRNYKYISSKNSDLSTEKRCRDVNNWLNTEIHFYSTSKNIKTSIKPTWIKFIETIWVNLQKENPYIKCSRQTNDLSINEIYARKELDDFCENRNYFENSLKNNFSLEKCQEYSNYVKKEKNSILNNAKSILNDDSKYNIFNISNKCNLQNIDETFPEIICKNECMYEKLMNNNRFIFSTLYNIVQNIFKGSQDLSDKQDYRLVPITCKGWNENRGLSIKYIVLSSLFILFGYFLYSFYKHKNKSAIYRRFNRDKVVERVRKFMEGRVTNNLLEVPETYLDENNYEQQRNNRHH